MTKVLAALAAVAALSACSSTALPTPQVASINTGSAVATTTSAAPESNRPYVRLDATQDEINKLWHSLYACLADHGRTMIPERGSPDENSHTAADAAAEQACADKVPYGPDEMDPKKNPHYLDDYHVYLKCMNDKGLAVHAIDPFGTGWTYDDGVTQKLTEDQMLKVETDCHVQAFGNH